MELIEMGNEVCNSIGRASAYGVGLSSSDLNTVTTRQGRDDEREETMGMMVMVLMVVTVMVIVDCGLMMSE